jgi:hypothetical protein
VTLTGHNSYCIIQQMLQCLTEHVVLSRIHKAKIHTAWISNLTDILYHHKYCNFIFCEKNALNR